MYKSRRQAVLDAPPPPNTIDVDQCYGNYCIKATVEMSGKEEKTFIGYGQDLDIATKTKYACERIKNDESGSCGDPEITFRGGECQEALFVKSKNGKMIQIFI
jgi:hypothetical protein